MDSSRATSTALQGIAMVCDWLPGGGGMNLRCGCGQATVSDRVRPRRRRWPAVDSIAGIAADRHQPGAVGPNDQETPVTSSQPTVDRVVVTVAAGTTAAEALATAGVAGAVVVADPTGHLHDLAWTPAADTDVTAVPMDSETGRAVLRHSTAHVLAQAVQELFPKAKLGIGPPIENGFYYDFDVPEPFKPEDLSRIEKKMRDIVKEGQLFARRAVSDDEARAELVGEPYKQELIGLKGSAADAAEGASVEVG